jgi:glycosyltransferase involved in cell wall biosynthesis
LQPSVKLIALHHRLGNLTGHRYNEGLALIDESQRRGWRLDLLIAAGANEAVLQGLGDAGHPVFNDPTFDFSRTFGARVDDFVSQLRAHAEPGIERDDRVLSTVTTQCEACALARWAKTLSAERMPWFLVLFLSDRWNRDGARPDEPAELEAAALEFATLDPAVRERFILCTPQDGLARELSSRLRQHVSRVPAHLNYAGFDAVARTRFERAIPRAPAIAMLGGARTEKGSDRLADIIAACWKVTSERFIVQAHNEDLEPAAFQRLRALRDEPDVTLLEGTMERADYVRELAEADALLHPYIRKNYKQRNSGIFCEGVAAGLPSIVPSGTWLAEQIEDGRAAGIVYEGDDTNDIAEAIRRCIDQIEELTRTAAPLAGPWRESESLTACLDAMERLRSTRDESGL